MQVVNSVVMNHVTIGDGCSIQGSVICSNVQLQERVVLRDCQVSSLSPSLSSHTFSLTRTCAFPQHINFICFFLCPSSHFVLHLQYKVGAGFVVTAGSEYKGESLAKKEKQ